MQNIAKAMKAIVSLCSMLLNILLTGGKYGTSVSGNKPSAYKKSQEQKHKDFAIYGGTMCKICSKRIPGNKTYCYNCWRQYRK